MTKRKKNTQSTQAVASNNKAKSPQQKARSKSSAEQIEKTTALGEKTKFEIAAFLYAGLAILLTVLMLLPSNGVFTSILSKFFRLAFGLSFFLIPLSCAFMSLAYFRRLKDNVPVARLAISLVLICSGIAILLSVFTPGADADPSLLFLEENLTSASGYVGASIAWFALQMFGLPVCVVLCLVLVVCGIVIIGFSLFGLVSNISDFFANRKNKDVYDDIEYVPEGSYIRSTNGGSGSQQFPLAQMRSSQPQRQNTLSSFDKISRPKPSRATRFIGEEDDLDYRHDHYGASQNHPEFRDGNDADFTYNRDFENYHSAASAASAAALGETVILENLDSDSVDEGKTVVMSPTEKSGRKKSKEGAANSHSSSNKKTTVLNASFKEAYFAAGDDSGFVLPKATLLNKTTKKTTQSETELRQRGERLNRTLEDFGIFANVVGWIAGPTVTLFKLDLPPGVRVSKITALEDDIALALAAPGVRIFAPIPGTNYVGIEVPNSRRENVLLGDVLPYAKGGPLELAIGKDVEGTCIVSDLSKMPHLLIGGTTGSGKSVAINAMIMSILMRATPKEVRFIMIDPKRVEFTPYNGIPHLYVPVVTESREAASALQWGVTEMERRLKLFSNHSVRNILQYNEKVKLGEIGEDVQATLPFLVIIIDELADLMMNVGKEVEFSIARIAQLARAAGIHLIVATQRPSTNVVTGLIKANITNRISFNVASGIDSRVILDTPGAENLIGLGDMLQSKPEYSKPQRIQGCYVSEAEIESVVEQLKLQGEPKYHSEILQAVCDNQSTLSAEGQSNVSDDPLMWEAADIVVNTGLGSTSNIQRRLKLGYSRAGRIMDMLEARGIVGPPNGSKPREVLIEISDLEELKSEQLQ